MANHPQRGEIYLVQLPDDPKARPALIVSHDYRNRFANNVVVVPITTNLRAYSTHVLLPVNQGGLTSASVARCENLTALSKSRILQGPFGPKINAKLMKSVEAALMKSLDITP